jgi:hypothetical protein
MNYFRRLWRKKKLAQEAAQEVALAIIRHSFEQARASIDARQSREDIESDDDSKAIFDIGFLLSALGVWIADQMSIEFLTVPERALFTRMTTNFLQHWVGTMFSNEHASPEVVIAAWSNVAMPTIQRLDSFSMIRSDCNEDFGAEADDSVLFQFAILLSTAIDPATYVESDRDSESRTEAAISRSIDMTWRAIVFFQRSMANSLLKLGYQPQHIVDGLDDDGRIIDVDTISNTARFASEPDRFCEISRRFRAGITRPPASKEAAEKAARQLYADLIAKGLRVPSSPLRADGSVMTAHEIKNIALRYQMEEFHNMLEHHGVPVPDSPTHEDGSAKSMREYASELGETSRAVLDQLRARK